MNKTDLDYFKGKLETEKKELEQQLSGIGQKNNTVAGGWEATSGGIVVDSADENEVADKIEELEDNTGVVAQLDSQLNEVKSAIDRINDGTYGTCVTCGKEIERDRLEANPSAKISIKHGHPVN